MRKFMSKKIKLFSGLFLSLMLLVGSVVPAFAAGPETWDQAYGPWESIRVVNNNLTPIKTIGRNGYLIIDNFVAPCNNTYCNCSDQEPSNYSAITVHMQIRKVGTGEILADQWFDEHRIFSYELKTNRPVSVGEKVQVYFDVCSKGTPPGPYRKAHIEFRYRYS